MGSALALNLAVHGFTVAVTNREVEWITRSIETAGRWLKICCLRSRLTHLWRHSEHRAPSCS
ncbi:NAD binding 2 domain containing protein [Sulfitobacter guttiformis KCTC 32187]|nr:NAD binding 2 domain containing protein [Sulfitobacter guttiformis KCTC 32187]